MTWSIDGIKDVTINQAHELLLRDSPIPEAIRMYVRASIAGLAMVHGDATLVTVSGHGHLCEKKGDGDRSTANVTIERGAEKRPDAPTIREWVDGGYRARDYPPHGYESVSSQEEVAAAIKAQEHPNQLNPSTDGGKTDADEGGGNGDSGGTTVTEETTHTTETVETYPLSDEWTEEETAAVLAEYEGREHQQGEVEQKADHEASEGHGDG